MGSQPLHPPGRHSQDLTGLHFERHSQALATVQHKCIKEDRENNKKGNGWEEGQEEAAVGLRQDCALVSSVE